MLNNNNMKKFIITTISFLLINAILYPAYLIIWGEFAPKKLQKNLSYKQDSYLLTRLNEVAKYEDLDILFLGSSHCERSFDPRVFIKAGYENVFNLGSAAQTPINTELLIDRYLDQLKPKLVVYEVYPQVFCIDSVEASAEFFSVLDIRSDLIKLAFSQNDIRGYNSLLFSLYKDVTKINIITARCSDKDSRYISNGFIENDNPVSKQYYYSSYTFDFQPKQEQAFDRIIKKLENKGIEYILVFAPVPNKLYSTYQNIDEVDQYFANKGEYVNFNGVVSVDDKLNFYDDDHLNQSGATMFSNVFVDYLSKRR